MHDIEDESGLVLSLETRQKKERKELQSRIQSLKKSAKNDKTRKKELLAEIARLELDLESRHAKELEEFEKEQVKDSSNIDIEKNFEQELSEETEKVKISKAQKRRNKKLQQEREREAEIKLQEKENIHGPRNLEIQGISARLKQKNLKIYSIPSDGDCLYKAVAHQLALTRNKTVTVEELRGDVSLYIRNNKDDFLPFLSNPDTFETLTDDEFEVYCDKISDTKVWGGQLEIRALSKILKCPITIIQATGPDAIEQGTEYEGPPLIITYHRHMYSLGEHYNSTQHNSQDIEHSE